MPATVASETRRLLRDPVLLGAIVVLWLLLALFVLYPLAELLIRETTTIGVRTVPDLKTAWRSLATSGDWMRHAWRTDRPFSLRVRRTLRVPVERFVTAIAQFEGARDSLEGRPPRRLRGV